MNNKGADKQYSSISAQTGIVDADPHRLIQMLYGGALDAIAKAKGCTQRGDLAGKGEAISKAVSIVGGLSGSINHDVQAENLTDNLSSLYDFVTRRLTAANAQSDVVALDEASKVLRELQAGWDEIRPQVVSKPQQEIA